MEIPALNDRYKERKLLSQQMSPKQSNSPECEENGAIRQRGKRACLASNQRPDDLYLEFNYLKSRCYLFLFQETHPQSPDAGEQ